VTEPTPPKSAQPESTPRPPRRVRYSGKNPRAFAEKYKEHQPGRYAGDVAKVLASGKTPAGTHRPVMVAEILEILQLQPGATVVDCTLGYGGHARELLAAFQPGGRSSCQRPRPASVRSATRPKRCSPGG
jgi:16S rRNA (cytosine1402-N4)-methyltransferase